MRSSRKKSFPGIWIKAKTWLSWVQCNNVISCWKLSWILCSDHSLCLPESAEPYEDKNSESLVFPFFLGFELVLRNISENGFSFLPAGTSGLTWVGSAVACELQVCPPQPETWLQLDLFCLRLGQEQEGITVATMAFLNSYITSLSFFSWYFQTLKAQWGLFRPQGDWTVTYISKMKIQRTKYINVLQCLTIQYIDVPLQRAVGQKNPHIMNFSSSWKNNWTAMMNHLL